MPSPSVGVYCTELPAQALPLLFLIPEGGRCQFQMQEPLEFRTFPALFLEYDESNQN